MSIREKALGEEHPDTAASSLNLAGLLFTKGNASTAVPFYARAATIYEKIVGQVVPTTPQLSSNMAVCHNQIAFHSCVPEENWTDAEAHYRRAMALFNEAGQSVEVANAEMNLQVMFQLSGHEVDRERVEELTRILEQANDKRAEKARRLLE